MADFKEGQGSKTHRDNDFVTRIADGKSGAAATDFLTIAQPGDTVVADTNDYGVPVLFQNESGDYCIPATDDNCNLKVTIVDDDDDARVHGYKNHSAVTASGGTDDFDTVITSGKKVKEVELSIASPGCMKYEIGEFDGTTTFDVRAVLFTQPASPSFCCKICLPEITGDGSIALRVRAINQDDTDNDAYTTVCFVETA
jgi:hypothetical protein